MSIALPCIYFLFCLLLIRRWKLLRINDVHPGWLQGLFIVKVIAGLSLWWIYTYHYQYRNTSDAFRYFDDSMVLLDMLRNNPLDYFRFLIGWNLDSPEMQGYFNEMHGWTSSYSYGILNDNPTIIRINALIGLLSLGCYHVHTVFMSFLSTVGMIFAAKGLRQFGAKTSKLFLALSLLLPSLIFWPSGVLKESPLFLLLGLLFYGLLSLSDKNIAGKGNRKTILLISITVFCLFFIKGNVILSFLPGILIWIGLSIFHGKKRWFVLGGFSLALIMLALLYPAGNLWYILGKKQTDFYNVAEMSNAGSVIEAPQIDTFISLITATPQALRNAYFLPWFNFESALFTASSLEVVVSLFFFAIAMFWFHGQAKLRPIMIPLWSMVLTLGIIIGITVPVVGAIVRYKVPALMVLVMMTAVRLGVRGKG